ncbi:MAG TPA: hypothetical protein VK324_04455, partial [Tepidisphaeraceae bacterium]|nr:hypothetical protein [Tepidisphaeraceae bacterium]
AARERAVAACDAWVGIGGSPFQAEQSTWFVDHLLDDARRCAAHGKRMYYLGVGVNDPRDVAHPLARDAVRAAARVWTRDGTTATALRAVPGAPPVEAGVDLSHAYLRHAAFAPPEAGTVGCVLNFEDARQYDAATVAELVAAPGLRDRRWRWLVQEDRPLPGSERALFAALPATVRERFELRAPDYATGSLDGLLRAWGTPQTLVTSRFHAAIIGAWAGARVVAVARAAKVRGVAEDLGLACVDDLTSAGTLRDAVERATPVPRERLLARADAAGAASMALLAEIAGSAGREQGRS